MSAASFSTGSSQIPPQAFCEKVDHFIKGYFDLTNSSAMETALKVISYATLIIPAIVLVSRLFLSCNALISRIQSPVIKLSPEVQAVLDQTPPFKGYLIGNGTNLTAATVRPANLFFRALFKDDQATTQPGSGELFAIRRPHAAVRQSIFRTRPSDLIVVSAKGAQGQIQGRSGNIPLEGLYGSASCRFSYREIQSTLQSQKIYTASILPLPFYRALKQALREDGIVTLPGHDRAPCKLIHLQSDSCRQLIQNVQNRFARFGFSSRKECDQVLDLTIYQLGSLVVKTEDYRLLTDAKGKIRERNPGERDAIRLINACGIRGIHATPSTAIDNRTIMTQAFQTALFAAQNGFVVFPAVGMGIWRGDPDLYWRSFLDAVVQSGRPIEQIFVNPRHQTTPSGRYAGKDGSEFQTILNEYRTQYAKDVPALANLNKIVNLYKRQTDVLHLSHRLKEAFPNKTVSLFNASDPDVTLGNHVGEYVNNLNHPNTTEENYTALGTNGLCFEGITGVHDDPARLIQVPAIPLR